MTTSSPLPRPHLRRALLAALALLALALGVAPGHAVASPEPLGTSGADTITTALYPGWNMVGWVGPSTPTSELFDAIPALRQVSAWDAEAQAYQHAPRRRYSDLPTLTPGMGLWLRLGGDSTVEWTRLVSGEGVVLSLRTGRNLVGWTGEDGASVSDVVARFGDAFTEALAWDAATQRFMRHRPGASTTHGLASLDRGDALRVGLTEDTQWWERGTAQPTFVFADDITAEQRKEVRALFESARDVIAMRFGVHTTDYTVDVSNEHTGCAAGGGVIDLPFPGCRSAVPHEYFHILQQELAGGAGRGGPDWMSEGSADYAQHVYEQHAYPQQLEFRHRNPFFAVEQLTRTPGQVHELDPRERFLPYALGFIAAEWLVDRAGEEAIVDFYRIMKSHDQWEDAFRLAFGIEVDDFYEAVEVYRHERAPLYPHLLDDRTEVIVVPLSQAATPVATEIREEITNLTSFYNERFGADPLDYTVYVVDEETYPSTFVSALADTIYCTIGFPSYAVFVIFDCEVPESYRYYSPDGDHYTKYIDAHHIYDILRDLAPPLSTLHLRREMPVFCLWGIFWLCDGVPQYAGAAYDDYVGVEDLDQISHRQALAARDVTKPLSSFEGGHTARDGWATNAKAESALFFLAASWLADHAGEKALLEYFRLLPSAQTIYEAFEHAFGLTLEEFYEQFEAYRATLEMP